MPGGFDLLRRLGSGYFGEVWLAREKGLLVDCALKLVRPDKLLNPANFYQEAQALKKAEHPNIVQVLDTGTLGDGRVYVSMEYLKNGSLEDLAQGAPLPLSQARLAMIDVLRGLGHAHDEGLLHRDIKPANILISDTGSYKLSDFGLALPMSSSSTTTLPIKAYQYWLHVAPEVTGPTAHTVVSDVYAAGITMYRLVNGDSAIGAVTPLEVRALAKKGQFPPPDGYLPYVPRSLKRVIACATNPVPSKRYQSATEFRNALEQTTTAFDWVQEPLPTGTRWRGAGGLQEAIVEMTLVSGVRWRIHVKVGRPGGSLRAKNVYSAEGLTYAQALTRARRVLLQAVSGKHL
jgi:eukaryotic-like serine/threonine-protein kinase